MTMERPGNPALGLFRDAGGPGLVIPSEHGGLGATPLEAIRVQRALAAHSPSLAVAVTMHHFSVATLVEMAATASGGAEWLVLEGVARQKLYVASGFAEGRAGTSIFSSQFKVRRSAEGLLLSGSKKPCSLSASMDLLTASVQVPDEGGGPGTLAVVLLPAATPGITRRPYWGSWALGGAESDEVILEDVLVPDSLLTYWGQPGQLDSVQGRSFLWFELLIAASYLGIASALVERVLAAGRGTPVERVGLAIETEGAMAALEGVAQSLMATEADLLARALLVRFAVQQAVERTAGQAAELLGGMAFIGSPEVAYLLASARALAFHPPSRLSAAPSLDSYLVGGPLRLE